MLNELKFHHMGIAVKSFQTILPFYKSLGYTRYNKKIIRDELQLVDLILLTHKIQPDIELVRPINDQSPVSNYLKHSDTSIYHICYEVDSFREAVSALKEKFRLINVSKPKPAILFNNRIVTFYYIHRVGLIEFLKKK